MKVLHALALTVCALAPYGWLAAVALLLAAHEGSLLRWGGDDWLLVATVVLAPIALAGALLRVRLPARHVWLDAARAAEGQRTTATLNAGLPSDVMSESHSGR